MSRHITQMTLDDAEHYTDEDRAEIIASYLPHEREARARGIPQLGSGRVFPVPEDLLKEPLLKMFPQPDLCILLDLSPKMGAVRKSDGTPEEYLAERRDLYRRLAHALGMEKVDAEGTPVGIHAEIRRRVWKKLGL